MNKQMDDKNFDWDNGSLRIIINGAERLPTAMFIDGLPVSSVCAP